MHLPSYWVSQFLPVAEAKTLLLSTVATRDTRISPKQPLIREMLRMAAPESSPNSYSASLNPKTRSILKNYQLYGGIIIAVLLSSSTIKIRTFPREILRSDISLVEKLNVAFKVSVNSYTSSFLNGIETLNLLEDLKVKVLIPISS